MKKIYLIIFFLVTACSSADYKYIPASNCDVTLSNGTKVNIFKINNLYIHKNDVLVGVYNDGTSLTRYKALSRVHSKVVDIRCDNDLKTEELKKLLKLR